MDGAEINYRDLTRGVLKKKNTPSLVGGHEDFNLGRFNVN